MKLNHQFHNTCDWEGGKLLTSNLALLYSCSRAYMVQLSCRHIVGWLAHQGHQFTQYYCYNATTYTGVETGNVNRGHFELHILNQWQIELEPCRAHTPCAHLLTCIQNMPWAAVELKPLIIACSVKPMAVPELIYSVVLEWAEDWQMTINPQKTKFLRITNKHNSISSSYYFKGISIPLSDHVK